MRLLQIVTAAVVTVLSGCATTGSAAVEAQKTPYPREKGKPVTIPVLGASYTFPAQFEITHYVDKPGIFGVEGVDRITGCESVLNFETAAMSESIAKFTDGEIATLKKTVEAKSLLTQTTTEPFKALNKSGRLVVLSVSANNDPNDKFFHSRFELVVPEQTLVLHGYVECAQDALRSKTVELAKAVFNSQSRDDAPTVAR